MPQDMPTKEVILRKSIHLFAEDGYESVSMKAIARAAGIQAASIYNHYRSKEEILGSIYQLYVQNQNRCRPTEEEYLPVLRKGSATEILNIFNYPMPDEGDLEPLMFDCIRVIWNRIYTAAAARAMYLEHVVEDAYRYIHQVIGRGIEMGRIRMEKEEVQTFAYIFFAARNFVASSISLEPDENKWRRVGGEMMARLSGLLVLNPPLEGEKEA